MKRQNLDLEQNTGTVIVGNIYKTGRQADRMNGAVYCQESLHVEDRLQLMATSSLSRKEVLEIQ